MSALRCSFLHGSHLLLLLLFVLVPAQGLPTTRSATVVGQGRSEVFQQRVEALVDGVAIYAGAAEVEVTRPSSDTLLVIAAPDAETQASAIPLVSENMAKKAVVVKSVGGRITSLRHHPDETTASLNYKRALASLLTPAHHSLNLAYHTQSGVLGSCEVHYDQRESRTLTWQDLTRCSHFTIERVLGGHHLPLLHLALELEGSSSTCEYRWRGAAGGLLEGVRCTESLLVAPRYAPASQVLNITLITLLTHTASAPFNSAALEHIQEATDTTDLTFQPAPHEREEGNVPQLVEEVCSTEGEERLTAGLLQKLSHLTYAVARSSTELPDLPITCPATVRRMVALALAVVGGPRTLHFFVKQLAELSLTAQGSVLSADEYLFTLALRSLVNPAHHTRVRLPRDFFLRRENQMVYDELVDYLLQQSPPAVAGVAALLEGLRTVAPQLFHRLLEKCGPLLSPKIACEQGHHAEAVRLLRSVSGLNTRPEGYVASLRPCFATDNVAVMVAAMDTLTSVDCSLQGVTDLQKLGLESPSDSEIRIAAYRGLVHCLPSQPDLLQTVAKALVPTDDAFSTQVASYVWSHLQSVISSEDPSLLDLRELLIASNLVSGLPDPVWYDPRHHSRHLAHTMHLDPRTSLTLAGDLVWGRYSPAPRSLYLTLALHHDGFTHQLAQVMLRVTGMEAMLLSVPLVEQLLHSAASAAAHVWAAASRLAGHASRSKREITQDQITEFIQQVMSRIPAEYRSNNSTIELYLRLLDTHALHLRLEDFLYSSPLHSLATRLQPPLSAALVALAPILDNQLTLATSSGVPVALGVHGVAGLNARAEHLTVAGGGVLNLVASGGVSVQARAALGGGRAAPLTSHLLWALDLPVTASYEYEGEGVRLSARLPQDWPGHVWLQRRHTKMNGAHLPLRARRTCWGSGEPLEVCLEARDGEEAGRGALRERGGWLAPYYNSLTLPRLNPRHPINISFSFPNMGGARVGRVVVETGGHRYEGGLVTQLLPSPSFALTFNTPSHAYLLKGLAGSRESITQVVSVEVHVDRDRYGVRLQLSTPQLVRQKVWSPSAFITTPEGGEEEVVRIFFSIKEEEDNVFSEFSFRTLGPLTSHFDFAFSSEVGGTVGVEDGSLRTMEIKSLKVTMPVLVDVEMSGRVHLALPPQGQGHVRVAWGEGGNQVEFSMALAPAVTFLGLPQHDPGGKRGVSLRVSFSALHHNIQGPMGGSLTFLADGQRVEVDLSLVLAHLGIVNFSHKNNGPLDFRTAASVRCEPLGVAWGAGHELRVRPGELRHEFNVSWSEQPSDIVSSLVQYSATSDTSLSFFAGAKVVFPGQVAAVEQALEEMQPGTYKSRLVVRLDPGRTLSTDTFLITRVEEHVFSYGLSNTLRLDSWDAPVSTVGTLNCARAQCSLMLTVDRAGDQLLDLEMDHNAAAGVSRTDARIVIMHWLNGTVTLDTAHKIGYYDLKWHLVMWAWQRLLHGRAEMNVASTDVVVAEALLQELLEKGKQATLTYAYNGTISFDQEARALFVRQEVRRVQGGALPVWAVEVEGSAGHSLLNSHHFGKGTLLTPLGQYYSAHGNVHSAVVDLESVYAVLTLSAGQGANVNYLLDWEIDLQQPNITQTATNSSKLAMSVGEETAVEAEAAEVVLHLESLGMLRTPSTGEVEMSVSAKRSIHSRTAGAGAPSQKVDANVAVRQVEAARDLGGAEGSFAWAADMYSLNGRAWLTAGKRSFGLVSFGAAKNQSLKSSHIVSVVDPGQAWGRLVVALETEHLGVLPQNFQSSVGVKVGLGQEEAGRVQALLLWTPAEAAINLALATFFSSLPGGTLLLKMWTTGMEGHAVWAHVRGGAGVKWGRGGRDLETALTYSHPGAALHELTLSLTFSASQPPHPPLSLVLTSRFSLNEAYRFALNTECRSHQEHYLGIKGALQRPAGSGEFNILLRGAGLTYAALGAFLLDGVPLQVTGSFATREAEQELQATINTSLLPETQGYTFKLLKRVIAEAFEVVAFLSQGGSSPDWVYSYRVTGQMKRDIKGRVRTLKAGDIFTHHILQQLIEEHRFFILVVNNQFDEMELEVEFPEMWPKTKVSGAVVKGKDSQLTLTIITPALKHLLEGRLLFSSGEWQSVHSGSMSYTQQDKAGRIVPFKLELDASRWNSNKQKYSVFLQRLVTEDPNWPSPLTTFEATLEVLMDHASTQHKLTWETDETASQARVVMGRNPSGGGGLAQYRRHVKGVPKSEIDYLLEGNYRHVDTELTVSCTFDQSSIGRPRAINFLHSEAEGYTELLLDLFAEEGDQVILVVTVLPHHFKFRIGQYGNTFLLVGYSRESEESDSAVHKVQIENSGRMVEVWCGSVREDARTCIVGGLVLETPTLAPTHNLLRMCLTNSPYVTVQVLGVEENEGPYLQVGQISGPGGVAMQVGSGRRRPLDTPPALTLTADVQKEVLEVLADWQRPYLTQLEAEFASRGASLVEAVSNLGSPEVRIEGGLGLRPVLQDTEALLLQAYNFTSSTSNQLWTRLMREVPSEVGNLIEVSRAAVRQRVEGVGAAMNTTLHTLRGSFENATTTAGVLLREAALRATRILGGASGRVDGAVGGVAASLEHRLGPALGRVRAALAALTYNDDQSLYALVSRVMGEVRARAGRREGVRGYLSDQVLSRVEKAVVAAARWDELRAKSSAFLRRLQNVTTISVVMPHQTALKIRVATPRRLGRDLVKAATWFLKKDGPRLLAESEAWVGAHWARVRYLLTWHVYGEAVVFGWDQAITWDGRQVTPLLTDACHHMLVLLTQSSPPTAITLHMEDLSARSREVYTFYSGGNTVTIDSQLKMTYNSKHIRRPLLEAGVLKMRWTRNSASVTSDVGLTLECQLDQALCRLAVSGEHFAGTAGLLGVFDFDNSTDFMTSGWEMPATEEEWVQSWRVATSGQCSSQLPESHISPPHGHHCTDLFHSPHSPYRWCFRSVSPSPYLQTCRAGWECAAQHAFLQSCSRHYHTLEPNLTCSSCMSAGEREEGTEGLRREVVIVTDFECWEDPQGLITALTVDHKRSNRVMVRYIGRGSPTVGPFENVAETVVDNGTPPLDAAFNAALLDFSERALKTIILFDCEHPRCVVSSSAPKIVKLRKTLLSLGVQLHVITMDPLTILDRSSLSRRAARQLIGLDGHTAYLLSHARKRRVKGKRNIRRHLEAPIGNTCTHMAVETDGAVFSLRNVKMEKKHHRRIVQQLVALRVEAGRGAGYLRCRQCQCGFPCTLCNPPPPLVYLSPERNGPDDDEDYEDEDEDLTLRSRGNRRRNFHRRPSQSRPFLAPPPG